MPSFEKNVQRFAVFVYLVSFVWGQRASIGCLLQWVLVRSQRHVVDAETVPAVSGPAPAEVREMASAVSGPAPAEVRETASVVSGSLCVDGRRAWMLRGLMSGVTVGGVALKMVGEHRTAFSIPENASGCLVLVLDDNPVFMKCKLYVIGEGALQGIPMTQRVERGEGEARFSSGNSLVSGKRYQVFFKAHGSDADVVLFNVVPQ